MKTLILSFNAGGGHNSCAKAIKEYFDAQGEVCDIVDALSFSSPKLSDTIGKWHVRTYRYFPWFFRWGYELSERRPYLYGKHTLPHHILTRGSASIAHYIRESGYDTVICTHVFCSMMITDMLEHYPMDLTTAFVATDYTCSPPGQESDLQYYFIPDLSLSGEFLCDTITEDKLIGSGIPVRQSFYDRKDVAEAKAQLGLPENSVHMLLMCGSMGCGPMEEMASILSGMLMDDMELSIVCGTNELLQHRLEKEFEGKPQVHIYGFVQDMSTLMDSADLCLTKPGGLSTTEAEAKHLPMVLVNAVAGCEDHNLKYYTDLGGAVTADTPQALAELSLELLQSPQRLRAMQAALAAHTNNSAAEIYQVLHAASEKKTHETSAQAGSELSASAAQ